MASGERHPSDTDAIHFLLRLPPRRPGDRRQPAPLLGQLRPPLRGPLVTGVTCAHACCSPDHVVDLATPLADVLRVVRNVPGSALRRRAPHRRRYTPVVGRWGYSRLSAPGRDTLRPGARCCPPG